jgi:proteasome lid subunit RPN8/RPN11
MPAPTLRRITVPRSLYEGMLAQARAESPLECCGLLAGVITEEGAGLAFQSYPLLNAAASPVEFFSDPKSMLAADKDMRRLGVHVLAVYHSHPTSAPLPSKKDLAESFGVGVVNFIISLMTDPPQVGCWWLGTDNYNKAEWEVVEDHPSPTSVWQDHR